MELNDISNYLSSKILDVKLLSYSYFQNVLRNVDHFILEWKYKEGIMSKVKIKRNIWGTSLVVQWLRLWLPMQGTWVQFLVQEGPTCHRTAKPMQQLNLCSRAWVSQPLKSTHPELVLHNKRSHCDEKQEHHSKEQARFAALEKACRQQRRLSTATNKNKHINKYIF